MFLLSLQRYLTLFSILAAVCVAADNCYYPDKSIALGHVPCSDDPNGAPCCASDHICMGNGLCLNVGSHQPYGFSRAACTSLTWGGSCPRICVGDKDHQNGGCAIIPYISNGQQTEYCCDGVVSNGSKAVCAHGQDSFKLTDGAAITGRAYLAKDAVTGKSNNKKDVAIGAGVGVPLGVLFLTALGWALYERKRRYSLLNSPAVASAQPVQPIQPVQPVQPVQPMQPEYGHLGAKSVASREMQAPMPLQELGTPDGRKPQELDGRSQATSYV